MEKNINEPLLDTYNSEDPYNESFKSEASSDSDKGDEQIKQKIIGHPNTTTTPE